MTELVLNMAERLRLQRYEDALKQIVSMLEPLGWVCPESPACQGCQYELDESLVVAMNVLAGLDAEAHMGPGHTSEQMQAHKSSGTCVLCRDHRPTRAEIDAAWEAYGFVKDGELWRRGTAF